MKFLIELIGALVTGALAGVLLVVLGIDVTAVQAAIVIGGVLVISSLVNSATAAVSKKINAKKQAQ